MTARNLIASLLLTLCANAFAADYPLDLSKNANMGFKDEVAGDGQGGWSDQGDNNDFADFNFARSDYEGIKFSILNPAKNGGKAILTFDSPRAKTGLVEAVFDLKDRKPEAHCLYLLHTSCWNMEKAGSPIGVIEATYADGSKVTKEIKAGIDVADWWNPGRCANAKIAVKKMNKSSEVGVFLSKIPLTQFDKQIESLKFRTTGKAIWIVVGATLSTQEIVLDDKTLVFNANDEWKLVAMADIQVKAGSALDLSPFREEGPAGQHGRAIVNENGALAFADSPEIPRKLFGFTGFFSTFRPGVGLLGSTPAETEANSELFAELVKRQGYNLVRPLASDGFLMRGSKEDCVFNPENQKVFDKLLFELKKRGIYSYLTVAAYCVGRKDGLKAFQENELTKQRMFVGDETVRKYWFSSAKSLLEHKSPYTGMTLLDDPSVVCVEIYNEQDIPIEPRNLLRLSGDLRTAYDGKWREWLVRKYQTRENLEKAFGVKDGFEGRGMQDGFGPLEPEFRLFLESLQTECLSWCAARLREIGYKGLISQYNAVKTLATDAARWKGSEVADMHEYFNHPIGFTHSGSRCGQGSSVGLCANYFRTTVATRLSGRPFAVSEYNHAFWNKYQHEDAFVFPAYSALQGFSAIMIHEDAVALKVTQPNADFTVARSPIARANQFVGACLYMRGDLKQAKHSVQVRIPDSYFERNAGLALNTEQTKIGLLTGFSIAFPSLPCPKGLPPLPTPDIALAPDSGAEIVSGAWTSSNKDSVGSKFSIASFVSTLKEKGLLPKENGSDPAKGIYQSETGEIVLRAKENLLKVETAKTEGVTLEANKAERIKALTVEGSSVPAAISVSSMDGQELSNSKRLTLVYSTEIANSGMELSEDRVTMIKVGKLPTLMRCGTLNITLNNSNASQLSLYALGFDGTRKEKLSVAAKGETLKIQIDTSKLKDGPTPFFELVSEN